MGLQIRSFERDDSPHGLQMSFNTEEHHQAFPGMVNGGIIGTLLDYIVGISEALVSERPAQNKSIHK